MSTPYRTDVETLISSSYAGLDLNDLSYLGLSSEGYAVYYHSYLNGYFVVDQSASIWASTYEIVLWSAGGLAPWENTDIHALYQAAASRDETGGRDSGVTDPGDWLGDDSDRDDTGDAPPPTTPGSDTDDSIPGSDYTGNDVIQMGSDGTYVDAGAGTDIVLGSDADEHILGGEGNDTLDGGGGADTLQGGTDDDVLTGGAGDDIAVWDGNLNDFTLTFTGPDEVVVSDDVGTEGTDIVSEVEIFQFGDQTLTYSELYDSVFAGTAGADIVDYDVTLGTGAEHSTTGAVHGGGSIEIDGGNSTGAVAQSQELGGDFAIAAWARFDDLGPRWQRVFDFGDGARANNILLTQMRDTNDIAAHVYNGDVQIGTITVEDAIEQGQWAHWALVADGNDLVLYKNGEIIGSDTMSETVATATRANHFIGKSNWSNDAVLDGGVADVLVRNDAISHQDIETLYEAALDDSYGDLELQAVERIAADSLIVDDTIDLSTGNVYVSHGGAPNGGSSVEMDGSNYAWGAAESLELGGDFTIGVWARFDDLGDRWQRAFDFGNGSKADNILLTQYRDTDDIAAHVYNGDQQIGTITVEDGIDQGQWAHWTLVADDFDLKLFKNGELVGSDTMSAQVDVVTRDYHLLGKSNWSNDDELDGGIADVFVHDEALADYQVAGLYDAATTGAYDEFLIL